MDISIIIPTYNRKRYLENCLKSLLNQNYSQKFYEIIVIDDGSSDKTQNLPEFNLDCVKYFRQEHTGASAARNLGIKKTKGEILAFIDDDCISTSIWIKQIIHCHKIHREVKVIQGAIGNYFSNNLWAVSMQNSFYAHLLRKDNNFINWIITSNISFKKETFNKTDIFDERFLGCGCEDYDLAYKLNQRGERILYVPEILVYHYHRRKFGEFMKQQFNFGRNRYKLDFKWKGRIKTQNNFKEKFAFWFSIFLKAESKSIPPFLAATARKISFLSGYIYEKLFRFRRYTDS